MPRRRRAQRAPCSRLAVATRLGLTCFGGPIAHIGNNAGWLHGLKVEAIAIVA